MTPLHSAGPDDDWTAADDLATAQREAAKLRVFDAAHKADEPHWRDDDRGCFAKGLVAALAIVLPVLAVLIWWAL